MYIYIYIDVLFSHVNNNNHKYNVYFQKEEIFHSKDNVYNQTSTLKIKSNCVFQFKISKISGTEYLIF